MNEDDIVTAVAGGRVSRRWLLRSTANLTAGFVAVGALHLVGKKSVLDLLEAKGYKIQRLEP